MTELRTAPIPQYSWITRPYVALLALLFAAVLVLPPLGWLMDWQGPALNENRNLAPPPDFLHTSLSDLPARMDAYYGDHVGFRRAVISSSAVVLHQVLGQPSADVIIGKSPAPGESPWFFYAMEGVAEDRLGMGQATTGQLESWKKSLEARAAWLKRRGIEYLFVIMPEKSSVYPELLPDYFHSRIRPTRLDQIRQYLKESASSVRFLDLNETFLKAKSEGPLFFPYDTHWNGLASFHAYQAILSSLKPVYPDLAPGGLGRDFEIRAGPDSFRVDLAAMLGLNLTSATPLLAYAGEHLPQQAPAAWPTGVDPAMNPNTGYYALETPGQRGRLLVFHDSAFIAPLYSRESQPLAQHFGRSYFAWMNPSEAAVERFVEMEHPDLVVEEHGERLLRLIPPPPASFDVVTPRLRRADGAAAFSIERINNRRAKRDDAISSQGELRIEGRAFDRATGRAATGVEIVIDGVPRAASYGLESPEDGRNVGFLADYSVAGLAPGGHTLGIRVIASDGASYTEAVWGSFRVAP